MLCSHTTHISRWSTCEDFAAEEDLRDDDKHADGALTVCLAIDAGAKVADFETVVEARFLEVEEDTASMDESARFCPVDVRLRRRLRTGITAGASTIP